jgi:hypothetical protein
MTRRAGRAKHNSGGLKALLLTASVMATFAGARLLALQEPVDAVTATETAMVSGPADSLSAVPLPQSGRGTKIELKPIPQAAQPRLNPIVRTRSSR